MAEKDKEKSQGEFCDLRVCKAENGYKVCVTYEPKEQSLAQRAGWVPPACYESKDYVEKTKAAVVNRIKELLG